MDDPVPLIPILCKILKNTAYKILLQNYLHHEEQSKLGKMFKAKLC